MRCLREELRQPGLRKALGCIHFVLGLDGDDANNEGQGRGWEWISGKTRLRDHIGIESEGSRQKKGG